MPRSRAPGRLPQGEPRVPVRAQHQQAEAGGGVGGIHHAAAPAGYSSSSAAAAVRALPQDPDIAAAREMCSTGVPASASGRQEFHELIRIYLARTGYAARAHQVVSTAELFSVISSVMGLPSIVNGILYGSMPRSVHFFKREVAAGIRRDLVIGDVSHVAPAFPYTISVA